jgi:hypothetical protein
VHAVAELHDTAYRKLEMAPDGLGVVCTVQEVPFHTSANVMSAPELFWYDPTAVQAVAEVHDTASSPLPVAPGGLGVVCTAQEVPFHTSANVTSVPDLFGW